MALNIGTLYAQMQARAAAFTKGMADGSKSLERFAKEAKRVSSEVAQVSAVFAGMGAAALHLASSVDGPTKQAMGQLEKSTKLLAVQVADILLPAVRELTAMFRHAAGVVAGLDPEVKKQISSFAVLAVQIAVASKAFSMFSGLAANVFGVLKAGFGMVAAIGVGPLLNIVAAVGLVIAAVLLLHRAWRKNWGGIQDATKDVLDWFHSAFTQLGTFFGSVWDFLVEGAENFIESILSAIDVLQELTGKKLVDTDALREGFAGLFKDLKSGAFLSEGFKFGKKLGEQIVDGLVEEMSVIKAEVTKALGLKAPSQGQTIGLGRSEKPQGDISGMSFAADESMRQRAMMAAAELREMTAEAARFKKQLAEVDLAQAVKKWVRALDQSLTTSMKDGLASVSLSDPNLVRERRKTIDASVGTATSNRGGISWQEATKGTVGKGPGFTFANETQKEAAKVKAGLKAAGQILVNGLGEVGRVINGIAAAARDGGPWGALMAAVMEVFDHMKSFQQLMDTLSYGLERLGQFMEPLVGELFGVVETLTVVGTEMLAPLFEALEPLFGSITKFAKGLIPILTDVGTLFEAIAPLVEFVGTFVGGILEALKPLLDIVGGILKGVATVLLGIIIALNELAALFGDEKAKAEAARLRGVVDKMWAPAANELAISQGEAARQTWRNAAAQEAAADSAKKVAESLSNVPAGYKIAHARYQADLGITSANGYMPGGGAPAGTVNNFYGDITTDSDTLSDLAQDAREARREAARERGQRRGNTADRDHSGSGGPRG